MIESFMDNTLTMQINHFLLFLTWNGYFLFTFIFFSSLFFWLLQVTFVVLDWINVINIRTSWRMAVNPDKIFNFTLLEVGFQRTFHVRIYLLWFLKILFWTYDLSNKVIIISNFNAILRIFIIIFFSSHRQNTMLFILMF